MVYGWRKIKNATKNFDLDPVGDKCIPSRKVP